MKVSDWNTNRQCWERRKELCLGYDVTEYDQEAKVYTVSIYAVQNDRMAAPLGVLRMKKAEWDVFFKHAHQRWECLDYPKPNDEEPE